MHAARVRATHKNFKNCEEMEMSAYHRSRPEVQYKVVLLGDYGVGKTSLFRRLRGDTFEGSTSSTVATGVEKCTRTFRMANGKSVMVSDSLLLLYRAILEDLPVLPQRHCGSSDCPIANLILPLR